MRHDNGTMVSTGAGRDAKKLGTCPSTLAVGKLSPQCAVLREIVTSQGGQRSGPGQLVAAGGRMGAGGFSRFQLASLLAQCRSAREETAVCLHKSYVKQSSRSVVSPTIRVLRDTRTGP